MICDAFRLAQAVPYIRAREWARSTRGYDGRMHRLLLEPPADKERSAILMYRLLLNRRRRTAASSRWRQLTVIVSRKSNSVMERPILNFIVWVCDDVGI